MDLPKMDLIDRYLAAIGALLPKGQREDITAELRDAPMTRAEEKQAELGRPLSGDEEAALLRAFGNPLAVATRYGRQQYLVGPELYPLYIFVLKILLAIVAVSAVVTGVVTAAIHPGQNWSAVAAAQGALVRGAVGNVGVLTIIAAILQRQNLLPKFVADWNPKDLPKPLQRRSPRRQTRLELAAGVVVQTLFVLWWTHALAIGLPYVASIPLKAGQSLELARAPIWNTLFWPVLGLALAVIALHVLKLAGRDRRRSAQALDLACQLAGLIVAWVALSAGHWVEVSASGIAAAALAKVDYGVNIGVKIGLIVVIVASAGRAAYEAWRLYRDRPPSRPD